MKYFYGSADVITFLFVPHLQGHSLQENELYNTMAGWMLCSQLEANLPRHDLADVSSKLYLPASLVIVFSCFLPLMLILYQHYDAVGVLWCVKFTLDWHKPPKIAHQAILR